MLAEAISDGEFDKIDMICDRHGVTLEQLPEHNDATLVEWVREDLPEKDKSKTVDVKSMRRAIGEYLAEIL